MKTITTALIVGTVTCMLCAATPLKSKTEAPVKTAAKPVFVAGENKIVCGNKAIQMQITGRLVLTENNKQTAIGYLYGNTPYGGWITNNYALAKGKQLPIKYGSYTTGVDSITADAKTNTVKLIGKLPYHKKNMPELLGDYTYTMSLLPNGKVKVELFYQVPAKAERGALNLIWKALNSKKYDVGGVEKTMPGKGQQNQYWKPAPIQTYTAAGKKAVEIAVKSDVTVHVWGGSEIALYPNAQPPKSRKYKVELEFDLTK